MKTNSSDALQSKQTFESLYISTRLGVLHPPRGMNIKEKKLTRYVTCRFRASLNHKDDGQTKFIKPNSQR